ncbi:ATP-binding protein [Acinetobacter junii]|uniref:ATP-binding protein n=1 Tax=Acinetobacter junii TaxID=40215 RepID=UPI0032B5E208
MNSDNDYKLKIKKELEKEQPDWALIEKLSSTVIDSKEDSLRFHVDAGHINKLGFELVGKQETALMELIKNAYDADATEVTVDFFNAEKEGGTLVIQDNGSGMDLETIKTAWMNISTDFKQENKISPKYGRVRAGRKGAE